MKNFIRHLRVLNRFKRDLDSAEFETLLNMTYEQLLSGAADDVSNIEHSDELTSQELNLQMSKFYKLLCYSMEHDHPIKISATGDSRDKYPYKLTEVTPGLYRGDYSISLALTYKDHTYHLYYPKLNHMSFYGNDKCSFDSDGHSKALSFTFDMWEQLKDFDLLGPFLIDTNIYEENYPTYQDYQVASFIAKRNSPLSYWQRETVLDRHGKNHDFLLLYEYDKEVMGFLPSDEIVLISGNVNPAGVAYFAIQPKGIRIDEFVISSDNLRGIGLGDKMMDFLKDMAKQRGISYIYGMFKPTGSPSKVKDFYIRNKFIVENGYVKIFLEAN